MQNRRFVLTIFVLFCCVQGGCLPQRGDILPVHRNNNGPDFYFNASREKVWDSLLSILLKDYNLNLADSKSGLITTEWDRVYLNGRVFRNKLTLRVSSIGYRATKLTLYNNVEILQENGSSWLPTKNNASEEKRLINNLSSVLKAWEQPAVSQEQEQQAAQL